MINVEFLKKSKSRELRWAITQDHTAVHPVKERDQRGELDKADPARADPAREDLHHQVHISCSRFICLSFPLQEHGEHGRQRGCGCKYHQYWNNNLHSEEVFQISNICSRFCNAMYIGALSSSTFLCVFITYQRLPRTQIGLGKTAAQKYFKPIWPVLVFL